MQVCRDKCVVRCGMVDALKQMYPDRCVDASVKSGVYNQVCRFKCVHVGV